MAAIGLFVMGGILGAFVPRFVPRENYFLLWDGFIALFCFIWVIHVATDIQRSDAITFDRILHLPVAFSQAFAGRLDLVKWLRLAASNGGNRLSGALC